MAGLGSDPEATLSCCPSPSSGTGGPASHCFLPGKGQFIEQRPKPFPLTHAGLGGRPVPGDCVFGHFFAVTSPLIPSSVKIRHVYETA